MHTPDTTNTVNNTVNNTGTLSPSDLELLTRMHTQQFALMPAAREALYDSCYVRNWPASYVLQKLQEFNGELVMHSGMYYEPALVNGLTLTRLHEIVRTRPNTQILLSFRSLKPALHSQYCSPAPSRRMVLVQINTSKRTQTETHITSHRQRTCNTRNTRNTNLKDA